MELCAAMSEPQTDRRIIEACQQGDRQAFHALFDAYKDRVYSFALHFLGGDTASAEDVTQEVFLRLFTRIGQYRNESEFATWLRRVVANVCIDEQRRRRRFLPCSEDHLAQRLQSPEQDIQRAEVARAVQAALADLNPDMRATVLLKHFDDLSYDEIATALRCSKGTIASRLHRCHKILARKLAYLRETGPSEKESC